MAYSQQLLLLQIIFFGVLTCALSPENISQCHKWSTIWASAPQLVEPANLPPQPFNATGAIFSNSTIRQTLKITLGASQIRLRFSNTFGLHPITINSISVALPTNDSTGVSGVQEHTIRKVTFNQGKSAFTVPEGDIVVSDPINISVSTGQALSISVYLQRGVSGGAVTGHPGSRTDSWITFGNQVNKPELTGTDLTKTAHWYFIQGIEGWVPNRSKYISILGDSITDGRGSTTNNNDRWTDALSTMLGQSHRTAQVAVGNQGLGGNCILSACLGPPAISRIDRDVLQQRGVTHAMIFEGINDIGNTDASVLSQKAKGDAIIEAYKTFIRKSRQEGLRTVGATITPFGGSFYDEPTGERQKTRSRVNEWIRTTDVAHGGFDVKVDFDLVVRDPKNLTALRKDFDSGDMLHPNPAAYAAMGKAFPLEAFE